MHSTEKKSRLQHCPQHNLLQKAALRFLVLHEAAVCRRKRTRIPTTFNFNPLDSFINHRRFSQPCVSDMHEAVRVSINRQLHLNDKRHAV